MYAATGLLFKPYRVESVCLIVYHGLRLPLVASTRGYYCWDPYGVC
jgi:hypothetical protein